MCFKCYPQLLGGSIVGNLGIEKSDAEIARLVEGGLSQVKIIAKRIVKTGVPVELGELISLGNIGLVKAAKKFDGAFGVLFKSYAEKNIRGAMLDGLRSRDILSPQMRQAKKREEKIFKDLEHALGREPIDEEMAKALGLSLDEYKEKYVNLYLGSKDEVLVNEVANPGIFLDKKAVSPEDIAIIEEQARKLKEAIGKLSDVEKIVINAYFYEDITLREISERVNRHESRICQIKTEALEKLRKILRGTK